MGVTRDEMVEQLRRLGIADARVLEAIGRVPRERFVRDEHRDVAYGDHALPIGLSQTISQPYIVARMSELLDTRRDHHVLEIGTGSGYQAAVLSALVGDVVSVERHAALADEARARLARLGYPNITVMQADASLGYPDAAPYDRILVTAAMPQIASELAAQLKPDGLIVAPVGDEDLQELVVRDATGREHRYGAVRFVPLLGEAGFDR
ncbi:MAG: protein-L-isoaspartate(D-aspartate) O-methyltransferase [Chloroflexota bacterium]|nr:protein-L-isoaspartate(D-aspartate) O-methyltransferase [Chloroflexota bacterium]